MESKNSPISIYALGGLCEVGKNTYCFESEHSLIIVDAGVMFPEANLPGVDYVIPSYDKLRNARQKIRGLIITHGHEDHIGGIPFLVQNVHIPVIYAPRLAAALIRRKLNDMRIHQEVNIVEYNKDDSFELGEFSVSFFHVTHSIPDSYGVCIDTPQGRIVHTGDFKIDLTPVGREIELDKIARIAEGGVDLLLSDSTNAEIEGYTPSESTVLRSIKEIFDNTPGRLILSTFSSNISRIQQIVQVAVEHKRYVAILGRSMEYVVQVARDLGYIKIPDKSLLPIEEINSYRPNEICVLCTGSQGEPMAALSRIANDEHKDMKIIPGDTVVFSSNAIPGNGVLVEKVVNQLVRKGCDVLTNSILFHVHSSGHPSKQELRLMLRLMRPKYFMPIHGEYRMLKLHGEIAQSVGIPKENIFVMDNGDILQLYDHKVKPAGSFVQEPVFVDGNNIHGLDNAVIKDREILQNNGLIAIVVGIDSKKREIIVPAKVITRAFSSEDASLVGDITLLVNRIMEKMMKENASFSDTKANIKRLVSTFVERRTERYPMVIPVVMDKN